MPTIAKFDADTHLYEPDDCFTRHLPTRIKERAIHVRGSGDDRAWCFGDRKLNFVPDAIDMAHRPGDGVALFSEPDLAVREPTDQPRYRHPEARLAAMDEQGVERALIYPNLGIVVENEMQDDVEALCANLSAYNSWLAEDWGFRYRERIFAVPVLSLCDRSWALDELTKVLSAGARAIFLRTGPLLDGKSPADPNCDPFWALLSEAGAPVIFHITQSGYTNWYGERWGEDPTPADTQLTPFQAFTCFGSRPMQDTFLNLALNNLFGRFPDLRVVSVENGSSWISPLLELEPYLTQQRRLSGPSPSIPSESLAEIIRRNLCIVPGAYEDPDIALAAVGEGNVLFGSDFPHPEGIAGPKDYLNRLSHLPVQIRDKIMGENAMRLLGGTL